MANLGAPKEVEALARQLRREGWDVRVMSRTTHVRWTNPDGLYIYTALTTRHVGQVISKVRRFQADPERHALGRVRT